MAAAGCWSAVAVDEAQAARPAPPHGPRAMQRLPERDSPLPTAVAQALAQAQVPADALAAVVLPVAGPNKAGWGVQADRPMPPSSTMKLVTSIVALDMLGPNHRGFTELLSAAPQQGDVLAGDLVLRGGADPELWLAQLSALLAELRWQGIREIDGDIVLDRTLFRPAPVDAAATPFDERPEFHYNQVPDALQLNGNLLGLEISSEGHRTPGVVVRLLPPLPGVQIDASALRLTERACRDWGDDWQSPPLLDQAEPGLLRIRLRGGFPRACTQRTGLALIDRLALAEHHLRWVWESLGGQWRGRVRDLVATAAATGAEAALAQPASAEAVSAQPESAGLGLAQPESAEAVSNQIAWADPNPAKPTLRLLARRMARPWGELLRMVNKQSDNPGSRLLYLSLGLDLPGGAARATWSADARAADTRLADTPRPTADLAARAVRAWLAAHQIPTAGLVLDNGSGLSRSERITPRQLALMLRAAHAGRWGPDLLASLPLAGVDGTMRDRLKTSPAAGSARLKTGTLKNAVALAGYVPDAQGRWWALAAMVSHDHAIAARPALDALVDWVARGGLGSR